MTTAVGQNIRLMLAICEQLYIILVSDMKFYIVTPTYNSLEWLERCVRSVADQVGQDVEVHHHVQDGCSSDGTVEWLESWQNDSSKRNGYVFSWESAHDAGMYDAINKAWEKMPIDADVTAHLNSDEQYLPYALYGVAQKLMSASHADILLSSYFVLDADSRYICHRRPVRPNLWISQTVCEMATCATFHRAEAFRRRGMKFDTQWRIIGDLVLYRDIVSTSPRFVVVPELLTTTFTVTGNNLGWSEPLLEEESRHLSSLSSNIVKFRRIAKFVANMKRRSCDLWYKSPRCYSVYLPSDTERTERKIKHPTSHWGCRTDGEV